MVWVSHAYHESFASDDVREDDDDGGGVYRHDGHDHLLHGGGTYASARDHGVPRVLQKNPKIISFISNSCYTCAV